MHSIEVSYLAIIAMWFSLVFFIFRVLALVYLLSLNAVISRINVVDSDYITQKTEKLKSGNSVKEGLHRSTVDHGVYFWGQGGYSI